MGGSQSSAATDNDQKTNMNMNTDKIMYKPDEPDLIQDCLRSKSDNEHLDRLFGCAYGQALGDAYGLSTEFETKRQVQTHYPDQTKPIPFPNYILTHHSQRWKRGDWTDDTDQWILILETLTEHNGDERVFARKLKTWIERGFPEVDDLGGLGIGANVHKVVFSQDYLERPIEVSRKVWERGGKQVAPNGAVMRCSAVALVHWKDKDKLLENTIKLCKTTHADPRCIASCVAICLLVAELIAKPITQDQVEGLAESVRNQTIQIMGEELTENHREEFLWITDAKRTLAELKLDQSDSIGYTYKCLASGFYGLRSTRPFVETLDALIREGGDADTNGAVCGTVYGARHGFKSLPFSWLRAMPFKKWFDQKLLRALNISTQ